MPATLPLQHQHPNGASLGLTVAATAAKHVHFLSPSRARPTTHAPLTVIPTTWPGARRTPTQTETTWPIWAFSVTARRAARWGVLLNLPPTQLSPPPSPFPSPFPHLLPLSSPPPPPPPHPVT